MKKIYLLCLSIIALALPIDAKTSTPIEQLNSMTKAHKNKNYELYYILQHGDEIKSVKYHHSIENNQEFAQLLYLDNAYENIVLRDDTIGYLGFNFTPFSLKGSKILDALPAVFHANFAELKHYNFIPLGKSRLADRIANVIKIMPSDNSRFGYTLWIDEENNLLLKSELYDEKNVLIEQFRVIKQQVNDKFDNLTPLIKATILPPVDPNMDIQNNVQLNWQVNWLPLGFKEVSSSRQTFLAKQVQEEVVESRLYSDGLATFTVYLRAKGDEVFDNQFAQQEKLTLFTHLINNHEIVIIGDIPMQTAKRIAQSVTFSQ